MKTILINVISPSEKYFFDFTVEETELPLGLEYLSSSLKENGFSNELYNIIPGKIINSELFSKLNKDELILFGLPLYSNNVDQSLCIALKIKEIYPNSHITVGGHLVTNVPVEILRDHKFIDSAVIGYGEKTIVEIAEHLKGGQDFGDIPGIAYRNEEQVMYNLAHRFDDSLDEIPFPRRVNYKSQSFNTARMVSSRGCYYLCKYCTTPAFLNNSNTKKKWSGRSVDNIVIEMEQLVKEDQIRQVIFCDDNFINKGKSSREKGNKLADSIIQKELKLKFWIMTRVDCYDKNDDDFVLHLKRAGLWGIFLGLETGSTKVIEDLNKRTTIEKNIETARLFKRNNIMIEVGFINFYPTSTTQDLLDNLELLYQLNEANYFNYFSNKLQLYPGIHLIHELRKKGLLVENYNYKKTDGYKFEHPEVFELYKTVKFVASKLRSHDLIIWNYKRLYQITVELVNFKENNESNTVLTNLISARDAIYSCLSEVNTINYNFMLKYLDTNLNKSSKSNLMNAHLEAVNIAIDKTIVPLVSLFEIKDYLLPSLDKTFLEEFFKSSLYQRIDEKEYCYG